MILITREASVVVIFFFVSRVSFSMMMIVALVSEQKHRNPHSGMLLLLDRDGVINEDVGSPGVIDVSQLNLIPGAGNALGTLRRRFSNSETSIGGNLRIAIITNQSCVGKGLITEQYLVETLHRRIQELLWEEDSDATIDRIFYCTTTNDVQDPRRKPNPGMIEEALAYFHNFIHTSTEDTDPTTDDTTNDTAVIFIGDTISDMVAAGRSGQIPYRFLVETGYGRLTMNGIAAPTMTTKTTTSPPAPVDNGVRIVSNEKEINFTLLNKSLELLGPSTITSTSTATTPPTQSPGTSTSNRNNSTSNKTRPASLNYLPFFYTKNLQSACAWILSNKNITPS